MIDAAFIERTEEILRAAYCDYLQGTSRTREESSREFDAWLDAAMAQAWDKGFWFAKIHDEVIAASHVPNPYRTGTTNVGSTNE